MILFCGRTGERIRAESAPGGLLLSSGDRWRQPLTREEAWRLAEAIDAVATVAEPKIRMMADPVT